MRFADPPIASVGVVVKLDERGVVENARILLQAVGVTPLRAVKAEKIITGEKVGDKLLEAAATLAAKEAKPISDVYGPAEYKRETIEVLTRHSIREAIKRAQAS